MKNREYQEKFETALKGLGERTRADSSGLEQAVWAEIAIRGDSEGFRWLEWLRGKPALVAAPVAALAVAAGFYLGFSRAEAYGKEVSLAMEQKYVESIHPVMMSASHAEGHATER